VKKYYQGKGDFEDFILVLDEFEYNHGGLRNTPVEPKTAPEQTKDPKPESDANKDNFERYWSV
jgi:hypothetical protein